MHMYFKKIVVSITLLGVVLVFALFPARPLVSAQETSIRWSAPANISNSEDLTSKDPFLLADYSGIAHLFWAEKFQDDFMGDAPDTIMYAQWDGSQWSKPVDIFFAPPEEGNQSTFYPHAVLDDNGNIHLIWMGMPNAPNYTLYYSSGPANAAGSSRAWQPRAKLAEDLTGTNYSIDIAYTPPTTVHIIYARVAAGESPGEERAVTYLRSTDLGATWSEPADVMVIPDLDRGASNTRLLVEPPNRVYACWTEWSSDGIGQAVYFDRSLDDGQTWEAPVQLSKRVGVEYERDWCSLGLLGPGRIVAMWEGGFRAYRYGMYSNDGGVTWSEPIDTFPWLIGENGFVDFETDSAGTVHLFVIQRVREGSVGRGEHGGLYHSIWMGDTNWQDPTLSWGDIPNVNSTVAIVGGNQVVSAWYSYTDYEVRAMTGEIPSAPHIPPKEISSPILAVTPSELPANIVTPSDEPSNSVNVIPTQVFDDDPPVNKLYYEPMLPVTLGVVFTILILVVVICVHKLVLQR